MDDLSIIIIVGTLLFLGLLFFIIAFLFLYQKRNVTHLKEKHQMQAQFTQTLLQSQLEIQEQTLQHFSNELHDNIAQVASIVKMNLHTIQFNDITKTKQKIEDTQELVRQLITDIKALSVNLNGERVAKMGLSKAFETEIERINKTELFAASFEQDGELIPLNDDTVIILYRMVQEILNNIIKHSNAKEISLKIYSNENSMKLMISDNGDGFDVNEKLNNGTGAGLNNLSKRAKLINATLGIDSVIGKGTLIAIELHK